MLLKICRYAEKYIDNDSNMLLKMLLCVFTKQILNVKIQFKKCTSKKLIKYKMFK